MAHIYKKSYIKYDKSCALSLKLPQNYAPKIQIALKYQFFLELAF